MWRDQNPPHAHTHTHALRASAPCLELLSHTLALGCDHSRYCWVVVDRTRGHTCSRRKSAFPGRLEAGPSLSLAWPSLPVVTAAQAIPLPAVPRRPSPFWAPVHQVRVPPSCPRSSWFVGHGSRLGRVRTPAQHLLQVSPLCLSAEATTRIKGSQPQWHHGNATLPDAETMWEGPGFVSRGPLMLAGCAHTLRILAGCG